ncbi:MAG: Transposase [uncultured Clostridium sp.]
MEKALNNLAEAMKEYAYKFMEKAKEIFEKFTRRMEEYFNSIDYDKYIKYKKRVKNRKILYAKRKAKYGK